MSIHTENGIYLDSKLEKTDKVLKEFSGMKLLDLGSGKGYVVFLAICNNIDAYGVEIDDQFYKDTVCKHRIIKDNMFNLDWNVYAILYYFLKGCNLEYLIKKKLENFKGIFILHAPGMEEAIKEFEKNLPLTKIKEVEGNIIYQNGN